MPKRARIAAAAVAAVLHQPASVLSAQTGAGGNGYATLVRLFDEWRAFQKPQVRDGVPDYTAAAMQEQRRRLPEMQARLAAIETSGWPLSQRIDHALVRAEMYGLDFDHRVLQPWARDPAFYAVVVDSESDTPLSEGSAVEGVLELWRYSFPLREEEIVPFQARLRAIPRLLDQARGNLRGDARDLWRMGIRVQQQQGAVLAGLAETLARHHPALAADAERARQAADAFRGWLEQQLPAKKGPSGVGKENYDWYLRSVHLVPLGWQDELVLMQRELDRGTAYLKLEEQRNRALPPQEPPASEAEWRERAGRAVEGFLRFADERVFSVAPYAAPALRARIAPYLPAEQRDFFNEVDLRDPRVMRCHQVHWIDKARMRLAPHASPIRRVPSLYNIWDNRAEGLATGMEELMLGAGLFDDSPRSRELVYIMVAQRAARALAGLRVQSNEWGLDEAVRFASGATPRGWFRPDGDLVWFEQHLYLRQPGYGTSYLTGKALIEGLLAERARQQGAAFSLKAFMDDFLAAGMLPVSLIRSELTGIESAGPPGAQP